MTTSQMHQTLNAYQNDMIANELSRRTQQKYHRDILHFLSFCGDGQPVDKGTVMAFKEHLIQRYKVSTANSYLISLNRYLCWLGCGAHTVKTVRTQRKTGLENTLDCEEYSRLLDACLRIRNERNYLLLRTLAATGIRVGELSAITREAAEQKVTAITHKGKCRHIFFSAELSRLLLDYCRRYNIRSGIIFHGKETGTALHPSGVWKQLKRAAADAGVDPAKVYPHSLRHLFAKTYMEKVGNIFELADLLGHSHVETTRIYARTSNLEKLRQVDKLML